jgi:PKD repeat protein
MFAYNVSLEAAGGTVTYTNFVNNQPTFTSSGQAFTSNSTQMTVGQFTLDVPNAPGTYNLFRVTITGQTGSPAVSPVPFVPLSTTATSFGTQCSGNDFDNTYKLGSDWLDVDGLPAGVDGNLTPVITAPATVNGQENAPVSVTGSASDPDAGQTVTLSQTNNAPFLTGPASAGPSANPSITLTGTPNFTQAGTYTINWHAVDNATPTAGTADATTSVVIANTDRAPAVTAPATRSGAENTLITFTVTAADPDGDAILSLAGAPLPSGATFTPNGTNTSGTFNWTPSLTQAGTFTVTWTAVNDLSGTASTVITVTDVSVDRAPVVTAPAAASGAENTVITFTVTAEDPDGDAITTFTANTTALPAGNNSAFTANAARTSGTFSWTPTSADGRAAAYDVTFTASNALSGSATTAITVTDVPVDRAPVVTAPATASGAENTLITFTVTAADPDGDAITTLAGAPLPTGATFTPNASNTSGTFSWIPLFTQAGTYTVTFTASNALSGTASTVITVANTDLPPVLAAIADINVSEGGTASTDVSASDPDGDAITLTASLPAFATLDAPTSGTGSVTTTVTASPGAGTAGTYPSSVTATALTLTDTANFSINVAEAGDEPPVLAAIADINVDEGATASTAVSASDPDGDAITLTASLPAFATLDAPTSGTGSVTTTVTASPGAGTAGTYPSSVTATALTLTDTANFSINVAGPEDQPVVLDPISNIDVAEGATASTAVSASDPDGDEITLTASLPAFATLDAPTSGTGSVTTTVTASPGFDDAGSHAASVTATAGASTDTEEFTINVAETDQAPVLAPIGDQSVAEGATEDVSVSATDADGDEITLTASLPLFATLNAPTSGTGSVSTTITLSPLLGGTGTFPASVTATANGVPDSESFDIVVTGGVANQDPEVTAPAAQSVNEGVLLTFGVSATDADGDDVALEASGVPAGASFEDNGDNTGTFSWTPDINQAGIYTVTFTGSDGNGGTGTASTVITVGDVNRAPTADAGGPYSGALNIAINFDGRGSSDPDGNTLTFDWDFGDGTDGMGSTVLHAYDAADTYNVTLTVTDPGDLSDDDVTTANVADVLGANAFVTGGNKTTRLRSGKPFTCIQIEPVGGSFSTSDVDLSSIVMIFESNQISTSGSKTVIDGDKNGNGVQEVAACFAKEDLRRLFADLPNGSREVPVTLEGTLLAGGKFRASLELRIIGSTELSATASPNPLNPETDLSFSLAKAGRVRVQIFDLAGRLVKTLLDEERGTGYQNVRWNGTNATGGKVATGVYYFRIQAPEGESVQRVTVMK